MDNPWLELPARAPYVLPQDAPFLPVSRGAEDPGELQLSVPPHPFAGCPQRSTVVLLLLNPGFDGTDVTHYNADPVYRSMVQRGLDFSNDPPLWCLDPRVAHTGAYRWLEAKTRWLSAACGNAALQNKFMQIQYLAYKSKREPALKSVLPSQRYSFQLLREAMEAGKEIVVMRSRQKWIAAVPELEKYPYMELRNVRQPFLSPGNLPPGGFERLCKALA